MSNSSATRDTGPFKTVCVGRYIVSLPYSATNLRLAQSFRGIDIDVVYPANEQLLHDQLSRLLAAEAKQIGSAPTRVSARDSEATPSIQVWQNGDNLYWVHGATQKNDTGFVFSAGVTTDSIKDAQVAIAQLIQSIQLRDPLAIPSQPGFCIERGFIPGNYSGGETASISADLPDRNASFLMSTNTEAQNTGGNLLARLTNLPLPLANLLSSDAEILRRGSKVVAGRDGDEYGYTVKQSQDVSMEWSALTGGDHATEPSMKISMDTNSAIPKDARPALVALWDDVLQSVKRR